MRRRLEPFRRHPYSWGVPLALLVANLVWLSAFGSGARLRAAALDRELERIRAVHAETTARLAGREHLWVAATENRDRIDRLYAESFATERARLTAVTREIKQLASRAGLVPDTISYPEESFEDYGLVRRSTVFSVAGTYASLRTFLHLLELTPSFVTVDQISVRDGSGGGLGISLRLSTLFAAPGVVPETADAVTGLEAPAAGEAEAQPEAGPADGVAP